MGFEGKRVDDLAGKGDADRFRAPLRVGKQPVVKAAAAAKAAAIGGEGQSGNRGELDIAY